MKQTDINNKGEGENCHIKKMLIQQLLPII